MLHNHLHIKTVLDLSHCYTQNSFSSHMHMVKSSDRFSFLRSNASLRRNAFLKKRIRDVDDSDLALKMSSYHEKGFPAVPDPFADKELDRVL